MSGLNPKDLVGAKKAPLTLVPPSAIIAIAEAMGNGAVKYGPFNWRDQPIQVRTYVEAALRHLYAYLDGQWAAEDTGISHLAHAMAGLAILYDATSLGAIDDNRSMGNAAGELRRQDKSVNPGDLTLMKDDGKPRVTYMGIDLASGPDQTVFVVEEWGEGDGPVYDSASILHPAFKADHHGEDGVTFEVERGPGGWYPCCGATEHTLSCPQWR